MVSHNLVGFILPHIFITWPGLLGIEFFEIQPVEVGGNQVTQNNLEIQRTLDNVVVYNQTIQSFQFNHTVPANTLVNGTEYRVRVRTGDISNNFSLFSDWVVFLCLATPVVSIDNITDGIVNNQTFIFEGSYSQANGELLQSYRYLLYNENSILLATSPEMFDGLLQYEFGGLQNQVNYKVELKIITVNLMEATTGLIPFKAEYIQPILTTVINLENKQDEASIQINANVIQIIGEGENFTYINDEKVDVTGANSKVWFDEGFTIDRNFTLKIWLEHITENLPFLKLYSGQGYIELVYYGQRIHAFKHMYNGAFVSHFASSNELTITTLDQVFIFIQQINDLIDIQFEIIEE